MTAAPIRSLPAVRLLGRQPVSQGPVPCFYTACGIECLFTGSELALCLDAGFTLYEPWISVELNGAWIARFPVQAGRSRVTLFRGMTPGVPKHVRVLKDVQAMHDDPDHFLLIEALAFEGGTFLPLPEPAYRLEFVGNSITAFLYPRLEPTPALSWATRYLGCGAGICVTASHNPAKYNGYKVYGADGCQITLEVADQVLKAIEQHDYFDSIRVMDYDAGVAAGLIRTIDDRCLSDFVDAVLALRPGNDVSRLKLVYTPLNGSGLEPVLMLLERMGIPAENITVVPRQREPDGDFPTCPYPNPEIREAMQTGLALCDQVHPDLMLGTDPDCDRMGAAVPDGQGGYRLITGNEMGVLLLDYSAGGTGLPAADVLEYRLAGGAKFMVRPSGTEPKIKVYLSAVGRSEAEADAVNERLAQAAAAMMQG